MATKRMKDLARLVAGATTPGELEAAAKALAAEAMKLEDEKPEPEAVPKPSAGVRMKMADDMGTRAARVVLDLAAALDIANAVVGRPRRFSCRCGALLIHGLCAASDVPPTKCNRRKRTT